MTQLTEILGCTVVSERFRMTKEQQMAAIEAILVYPLPQVRYRLESEGVIPPNLIDEAMLEWRRFMTTILVSSGSVGMISPIIDEVWHAFILFTKDYSEFCNSCFGRFIGHAPNWPGAPLGKGGGERFLDAYRTLYGKYPPNIWRAHLTGVPLGKKTIGGSGIDAGLCEEYCNDDWCSTQDPTCCTDDGISSVLAPAQLAMVGANGVRVSRDCDSDAYCDGPSSDCGWDGGGTGDCSPSSDCSGDD